VDSLKIAQLQRFWREVQLVVWVLSSGEIGLWPPPRSWPAASEELT
jgi:hypothetical protein